MHWIPRGLGHRAYFSGWWEEGAFCAECLVVFPHISLPFYFLLFISVTSACLLGGGGAHGGAVNIASKCVEEWSFNVSWSAVSQIKQHQLNERTPERQDLRPQKRWSRR